MAGLSGILAAAAGRPRSLFVLAWVIGATLIGSSAFAHPGHGVTPDGDSVAHYVLEPVHGLGAVVFLIATIACLAIIRFRATIRSRAIARRSAS